MKNYSPILDNKDVTTVEYVESHGGKIDKIKVNNVEQTITNKTVDITVPQGTITADDSTPSDPALINADLLNNQPASYYASKTYVDSKKPKTTAVTLNTTWTASGNNYTKTVTISGVTANSKIDVQPDATVIAQLVNDGVTALYFANNNGTVSAVAVGAKPTAAITVQVTITEVTT